MKIDIISMIIGVVLTILVAYLLPDTYKYIFNSKVKPKAKKQGVNNIDFEMTLKKQMREEKRKEKKAFRKERVGFLKRLLTKKNR